MLVFFGFEVAIFISKPVNHLVRLYYLLNNFIIPTFNMNILRPCQLEMKIFSKFDGSNLGSNIIATYKDSVQAEHRPRPRSVCWIAKHHKTNWFLKTSQRYSKALSFWVRGKYEWYSRTRSLEPSTLVSFGFLIRIAMELEELDFSSRRPFWDPFRSRTVAIKPL